MDNYLYTILTSYYKDHTGDVVRTLISFLYSPILYVWIPNLVSKFLVQYKEHRWEYLIKFLATLIVSIVLLKVSASVRWSVSRGMTTYITTYIIKMYGEMINNNIQDLDSSVISGQITSFANALEEYISIFRNSVIPNIIYSITLCTTIYRKFPITGILLIIQSLTIFSSIFIGNRKYIEEIKKTVPLKDAYVSVLDDTIRNIHTIVLNNNLEREISNVNDKLNNQYIPASYNSIQNIYKKIRTIQIISFIFLIIIISSLKHYKKEDILQHGASIALYFSNMSSFFEKNYPDIIKYKAFGELLYDQMNDILKNKKSIDPSLPKLDNTSNIFTLKDINVVRNNNHILKNINLTINQGEKVCIIGPIGSGKSTLVKTLLEFIQPTSGEIYFGQYNYKSIPSIDIRKNIAYIHQQNSLFNRSIYENIVYDNPMVSREEVTNLISQLDLNDVFDKFPQGLDTPVGKNGSFLSGGERQVVILLRSILQNPPIYLLDEPTSSMDILLRKKVYNIINNLGEDKTVIVVTHDPEFINYFSIIYEIQNGQIARK